MAVSHQGFLHDIINQPGDDTPRLVYADWLEENGDPERAEFIRVQIELAGPGIDVDRALELGKRQTELLARHGERWQQPFTAEMKPRFERGFVCALNLPGEELLPEGARLLGAAPVTQISLTSQPDPSSFAELAGRPFLSRLGLGLNTLDSRAVEVLVGDNRFAQLAELNLSGRGWSDADRERLKAHFGDRVRL
jgi:uncharacterized protein (TIGR02996 family)